MNSNFTPKIPLVTHPIMCFWTGLASGRKVFEAHSDQPWGPSSDISKNVSGIWSCLSAASVYLPSMAWAVKVEFVGKQK